MDASKVIKLRRQCGHGPPATRHEPSHHQARPGQGISKFTRGRPPFTTHLFPQHHATTGPGTVLKVSLWCLGCQLLLATCRLIAALGANFVSRGVWPKYPWRWLEEGVALYMYDDGGVMAFAKQSSLGSASQLDNPAALNRAVPGSQDVHVVSPEITARRALHITRVPKDKDAISKWERIAPDCPVRPPTLTGYLFWGAQPQHHGRMAPWHRGIVWILINQDEPPTPNDPDRHAQLVAADAPRDSQVRHVSPVPVPRPSARPA
ncbi:hypothetical protein MRS44_012801 [Fusarium solani]|uniref:uncharacterized protein n=1 Tax=Fusarium solani TaxID=169388 RepID=UPI0032C41444|nr:hypothetical protein MRS44_012801 [Fusarium solani]